MKQFSFHACLFIFFRLNFKIRPKVWWTIRTQLFSTEKLSSLFLFLFTFWEKNSILEKETFCLFKKEREEKKERNLGLFAVKTYSLYTLPVRELKCFEDFKRLIFRPFFQSFEDFEQSKIFSVLKSSNRVKLMHL